MSNVERMTVTIPTEMAATLRHTVNDGEYATTSEIVREALRDWTRKRESEQREAEALRMLIQAGMDSGPGIAAEDVYATLRRVIEERVGRA